jgi:acyl-CoA synthetase (NDP forming)
VIPGLTEKFAGDLVDFLETGAKPLVVIWNSWDMESPAYQQLVKSGAPLFRSFRNCFQSLHGYFEYHRRLDLVRSRPEYEPPPVALASSPSVRTLDPAEAADLLQRYGVSVAMQNVAGSPAEAIAAATLIGYPIVLKAPLAGFPHKSDVGLVLTGITSAKQVEEGFAKLLARASQLAPGAEVAILVQRQVAPGTEIIIGITRDDTVGPAILVGLGGIFTEVLRDVSVRPLPISEGDAGEMIRELKGFALLDGVRGAPKADLGALAATLMGVARLAADPDNRVLELDLNPVIAGPSGCVAVDSMVAVETG